ncbi:NADP-dependent oxidoreductase [Paraburkholderia pallida]|uniref:NADP-dependent oxidoreductase n=1 Tax=Paraburkholderia pallida TaxID=2547399 RepID=A0A4P7D4Q6_9BURK|nr:NADP-dependent oxidoreductase [Paraburkholderia pallida]QBR01582.1 NADP-dependent oxidoreductase [Paraburkholderia pallida]
MMNRRVIVKERPQGIPLAEHFELDSAPLPALAEGQILIRNHYLSVDPAMRGWLADAQSYGARIEIGDVMRAFAVGEVIDSRNHAFAPGDRVMGLFGWQEHAVVDPGSVLLRISDHDFPMSLSLGVLGLNGVTAYFGLMDVCAPKAGETVVVSTAAGAVGSCVGQMARILGCRVVGIAGGPEKRRLCIDEFGYDEVLDYKHEADLEAAIARACPNGVDVYFDNTAGPISDAVIRHISVGARIAVCGTASISSWDPWPSGPRYERQLLVKRATVRGFIALDYVDRYPEGVAQLGRWIKEGRLHYREEILEGIEQAPAAISRLYSGENQGKLLIRLPASKG